jgi:parallel beta-helix repeat protein
MKKTVVVALVGFLLLLAVLLVVSGQVSAQSVGVIRIKSDGTVMGTDKIRQDGSVYTLTADLYASVGQNEAFIFVEKSNVTFNGAGHVIQGVGVGSAIYMLRSQNVTVENFVIRGFSKGVDFGLVGNWPSDSNYVNLPSASNNKICNNTIEVNGNVNNNGNQTLRDAGWCIYLNDAVQTVIVDNDFICHDSLGGGAYFGNSSRDTSLLNNAFAGGGVYSLRSNKTTADGNTIDGKPLIFLEGKSDQIIKDAGLVYLFNCSNIFVKNINPPYAHAVTIQFVDTVKCEITNSQGHVLLINSSDNRIYDNTQLNSLTLEASSYNEVFTNRITDFSVCIKLYGSSNFNKIYDNLLIDTIDSKDAERARKEGLNTAAIQLGDALLGGVFNNEIRNNMIANHDCGFEFFLSSNNTLTANIIKNCNAGIQLGRSHYNMLTENNITSCRSGISIYAGSSHNTAYRNNFMNNQLQCSESHRPTILLNSEAYAVGNTWDNGKTGNYWDTYTGKDSTGNGIGDTPYKIFENMVDTYPLMSPVITSNTNNPPTYNPTARPTSDDTQQFIKENTNLIIVTVSIIIGVTLGVLIYFRRLIFR